MRFDTTSKTKKLCCTCPHRVSKHCGVRSRCGQVLACRAQLRASVFGRYPNGRVRKRAQVRYSVRSKEPVVSAWEVTRKKMRKIGDSIGCIWIGFLPRGMQVSVRRKIRSGVLSVWHLEGVNIHGHPAGFLSTSELKAQFSNFSLEETDVE